MRKIFRRLKQWGSTHTGRRLIPESLWGAAADLARQHGIYPTAKALHLEYGKLKQRVEGVGAAKRRRVKAPAAVSGDVRPTAPPTFVELLALRSGSPQECLVVLEGPRGRMRIDFKGIATAELVALSRTLWDGELSNAIYSSMRGSFADALSNAIHEESDPVASA